MCGNLNFAPKYFYTIHIEGDSAFKDESIDIKNRLVSIKNNISTQILPKVVFLAFLGIARDRSDIEPNEPCCAHVPRDLYQTPI